MELIPWLVAAYAAIWVVVYFGNRLFMYFPVIQQLGAETLWLLYLIVSDNQMGPAVERIAQIWPTSAGGLPDSPLLSDETLSGIAKPGAAFMTKMPDELGYLLSIIQAFKQLPNEQREDLLSDPWRFGRRSRTATSRWPNAARRARSGTARVGTRAPDCQHCDVSVGATSRSPRLQRARHAHPPEEAALRRWVEAYDKDDSTPRA
jgi:hypothetical protein